MIICYWAAGDLLAGSQRFTIFVGSLVNADITKGKLLDEFSVLRIPGQQFRSVSNFHVLVFKPRRDDAPGQSEFSRPALFGRNQLPGTIATWKNSPLL